MKKKRVENGGNMFVKSFNGACSNVKKYLVTGWSSAYQGAGAGGGLGVTNFFIF